MAKLGGGKKNGPKSVHPAPTAPTGEAEGTLPDDVPGVEKATEAPVASTTDSVSGPPSGGILLTQDELDDRVAKAVAKALAMERAERAATPPPPANVASQAGTVDNTSLATEVAKAVAMAIMANAQHQNQLATDMNLQAAMAKEAKVDKCICCGQAVAGCGGPWVKPAHLDKLKEIWASEPNAEDRLSRLKALKVDKAGYYVQADGRRVEEFRLNHKRMVVFPKNEENAYWYLGLKINNKYYRSNGPEHEIWVPAVNDFASVLAIFEQGEKRTRTPRKHLGSQGNGVLSGNGGVVQSPTPSNFM